MKNSPLTQSFLHFNIESPEFYMKIIYRYVVREFLESFLFGLAVFSSILLLDQIFQLINLFLSKGISLWVVVRLFVLILPNIFSLAVPMASLLGILLAYGRLSEDNEITALRSTGMSYFRFTMPTLALIALFSVSLVYFNMDLSPRTHRQFRKMYQEILIQRPLVKFEEKAITSVDEYRIYVEKVDRKTNTLYGINIYRFDPQDQGVPWRISASSAAVSVSPHGIVFHLSNGYWQKANPAKPSDLVHLNFTTYQFSIPFGGQAMPFSQSLREMSGAQLLAEIDDYKTRKLPTAFLENEYWLRWTISLAPLVLAIAGMPLGMIFERGGKSIGFGMSLLILFGFYTLLVTGLNIGEKGYIPARYILWLPDIVTLAVGVLLWRKLLKR
jgi:LPS export ABC transporter permease LptF